MTMWFVVTSLIFSSDAHWRGINIPHGERFAAANWVLQLGDR